MKMYRLCEFWSVYLWLFNVILLAMLSNVYAAPVFTSSSSHGEGDFFETMNYLTRYGYLRSYSKGDTNNHPVGYADIVHSIKDLQTFLRVRPSGHIDDATVAAIRRPRCGVTDAAESQHESTGDVSTRVRRYTVKWAKWDKKVLTYRFLNYPSNSDTTNEQVHEAIERAFEKFSNVTRLEFKELEHNSNFEADIRIKFTSWIHGDGYPFDGPNGTIAHAYLPDGRFGDYDGDIHFDDSEHFTHVGDYTHDGKYGYNLYQVALHEIGHSLGLDHSSVEGAVMVPDYAGYKADFSLEEDDIRAVVLLYGSGNPTSAAEALNPNAPCNKAYDAAAMIDNQLFIFKDKRFWRTEKLGKLLSPMDGESTKKRFDNLPRQIDAVYQRPEDGKVVFFKGAKYWVYDGRKPETCYPRPVTDFGLPLEKLDAAVILNAYNKTYFFRGDQVWRYDEESRSVDKGYPYSVLEVWEGIPSPVHAAFDFTDGNTYFLQLKKYFRYSSDHRNADPGYPRYFGQDFLGC